MRLMFAARVARPDLVPAITRLSRCITRWKQRRDFALVRIFSYLESSISLCLHGSLPLNCSDLELHCWPDADLAGEKGDSKSTGGYFVELHADGHTWPLGWQSKRQTSTAISTAESETISLQRRMHKEALPIQEVLILISKGEFSEDNFQLPLVAFEDNDQCITGVKKGYSGNLRHLWRAHRVSIGSVHGLFYPSSEVDPVAGELDEQPWLNCLL